MKRLLTTLMILLVVVVAGLTALILLVNPNDFRDYMVKQVAARSGYQLAIEGPLRWHVWPQLSILSGRMSLTAPGASQPVVMADNMRLDVALFPLLSHQLNVTQVMIKNGVVQLIPQSAAPTPKDAPIAPHNPRHDAGSEPGWSFDIGQLQIVDSVLVLQQSSGEQVTFRDIQLDMKQTPARQAKVELSMRVNRDQRDFALSLQSDIDLSQFPREVTANVRALDYQIKGAGLQPEGITGTLRGTLDWQQNHRHLALAPFSLSANDSDLSGSLGLTLGDIPNWQATLHANKLNFDTLLTLRTVTRSGGRVVARSLPDPVIAGGEASPQSALRQFNAEIALDADRLQWRGLAFSGLHASVTNQQGLLTLGQLSARQGDGQIALPGSIDVRSEQTQSTFHPRLENVALGPLLKAFDYPVAVTGRLSVNAELTGGDLSAEALRSGWQGTGQITLNDARLEGMNFQQLIQQAVSRSNAGIHAQDSYDNGTTLNRLSARVRLDKGNLQLNQLSGQSSALSLNGQGALNLIQETCDVQFAIRVNGGWQGRDSRLINLLQNTEIPLRIYGPWQQLSYRLQVEQIVRNLLQSEVKNRVHQWLDGQAEQKGLNDVKRFINGL